jgi:hypothetical protein
MRCNSLKIHRISTCANAVDKSGRDFYNYSLINNLRSYNVLIEIGEASISKLAFQDARYSVAIRFDN